MGKWNKSLKIECKQENKKKFTLYAKLIFWKLFILKIENAKNVFSHKHGFNNETKNYDNSFLQSRAYM